MKFKIVEVVSFPRELEPGILYWSKEFEMSAHLCACGCGDVVQLPIDPQNFTITQTKNGPTLRPSVGNWGICDAHYYITAGKIEWLPQLSPAQIAAGRAYEDARRESHYATSKLSMLVRVKASLQRLLKWLLS